MSVSSRVVPCAKCGQNNRIDAEKVRSGFQPKCGNCKAPLTFSDGPGIVDDSTFRNVVERSAIPVLVDFWAPWCGPCHMLAPVIEELAAEFSGRVRVVKLNTDESPNTSAQFGIRGIPTLILFANGKERDRMVGVLPKRAIADRIQSLLA